MIADTTVKKIPSEADTTSAISRGDATAKYWIDWLIASAKSSTTIRHVSGRETTHIHIAAITNKNIEIERATDAAVAVHRNDLD